MCLLKHSNYWLILLGIVWSPCLWAQCHSWEAYSDGVEKAKEVHQSYRDYFRIKDYERALPIWRALFTAVQSPKEAPTRHFRDGIAMYNDLAKTTNDKVQRLLYVDTINQLYHQWADCLGETSNLRAWQGYRIYALRGSSELAMQYLEQALALGGNETHHMVIVPLAQLARYLFRKKHPIYTAAHLTQLYEQLKALVDYQIENNPETASDYEKKWKKAYAEFYMNRHYLTSIWDCGFYEKKWKAAYLLDSNKIELNQKILKSLKRSCDSLSPFYTQVKERLLLLKWLTPYCGGSQPIFDNYNIGKFYELKAVYCLKEQSDSAQYQLLMQQAFDLYEKTINENASLPKHEKAELAYRIAYRAYYNKDFIKARAFCEKASTFLPNWGQPYLLIGVLYASSAQQCSSKNSGWGAQTLVWIALDMWEKARAVDANLKDEANQKIERYQKYLPTHGDVFQRGLIEGQPYFIDCWIQRKTNVRMQKE